MVGRWLAATALSSEGINSVTLTFNGACDTFAVLMGGDECVGRIDREALASLVDYEVAR